MITSGGTNTLGLYDNASEIRKKADISYVDSRVGDFQAQVVSLAGGHLGYATLALATTASTGLPANTIVEVTNDPTASNNGTYQWNGTTLTKSAYDPLTQSKIHTNFSINLLKNSLSFLQLNSHNLNTGEKIWLSIQDKLLRSVFSVGEKNLQWNSLNFRFESTSKSIKITDKIGRTILSLNKDGISFGNSKIIPSLSSIFSDKIGRSAIKINKDGSVSIPKLTVQSIKKQGEFGAISEISASVAQEFPKIGFESIPQRIGVISSGQSLNMGGTGTTAVNGISTTQPYSNVMFNGGSYANTWDVNYVASSFVPLVIGPQLLSEFPMISGCNALSRHIDKSPYLDANDYSVVGTVIGEGSQTVEQMLDIYLPRLKKAVDNFKLLCDKNGETGEIWALPWIQGEANANDDDVYKYISNVLSYMNQSIDYILETTKQAAIPYIYTYQMGSFFFNYPVKGYRMAQAQWLMSKSVPNVVCFTPMYIFDYADNLHLNPVDYWFMGEYMGNAIHHTQFSKQGKFRPTEPEEVIWTDNYIDIVYHAPKYPIRFTTDVCTQALNQGFGFYKNQAYVDGYISSVELKDYRTVRINLTQAITDPDFEICYARGITGTDTTSGRVTGNRGNVADSTKDSLTAPTGETRIISHHSVFFTYHKTNGFVV